MAELLSILEKVASTDIEELKNAQSFLEKAAHSNFEGLLHDLSCLLKDDQLNIYARMQAGIQLKNCVYSKDSSIRQEKAVRWLSLSEQIRTTVKFNCLKTLGTEGTGPSTAAQCVAYIACVEIPVGHWVDLMETLVQNMISPISNAPLKQSTLETIGYICQDINPNILSNQSNEILTAIINGMKKDEPSDAVKLAATNALYNSLEFVKRNFSIQNERNYIMQIVCEATQCNHVSVRVVALQCLVRIMSLYYAYMEQYMSAALFAISLEAMKSEHDEVGLQGIEFWSSVCDEEIGLAIEEAEYMERGQPPLVTSKYYGKGALQYIIPIIMERLTKKEEHDDEDEWNPAKAAAVCLMLLAQCCENDIVQQVIPFVTENIQNEDWRFRDAATYAFGAILEGPDSATLRPYVDSAMPFLIQLLSDSRSAPVRDTAAWTLNRICELHCDIALSESHLDTMLAAFSSGLESEPRVATNVCWALSSLTENAYKMAKLGSQCFSEGISSRNLDRLPEPNSYVLSTCFEHFVEKLWSCCNREDGQMNNLRSASYSALMEMMKCSAKDCYVIVQKTTLIVLDKLEQVNMFMEKNSNEMGCAVPAQVRTQMNDLQSLLCGALQSVLRRINKEDVLLISDKVMEALLRMIQNTVIISSQETETADGKSSTSVYGVQEDALLVVSALVDVLEEQFAKYLEHFLPALGHCLLNTNETQVCTNAIGLLGDMCRNLNQYMLPHASIFLERLFNIFDDPSTDMSLKPQIISAFGDYALAIGREYRFFPPIFNVLAKAAAQDAESIDSDLYIDLCKALLEAYSSIIQGVKQDQTFEQLPTEAKRILEHCVPNALSLLGRVGRDSLFYNEEILSSACGLIGDLASTFDAVILQHLEQDFVVQILECGRKSKANSTCRTNAQWATKEIRKLKTVSNGVPTVFQNTLNESNSLLGAAPASLH